METIRLKDGPCSAQLNSKWKECARVLFFVVVVCEGGWDDGERGFLHIILVRGRGEFLVRLLLLLNADFLLDIVGSFLLFTASGQEFELVRVLGGGIHADKPVKLLLCKVFLGQVLQLPLSG